ncbi:MAG: hypothetical protein NUW06_04270 [Candidatus Acetothermia bacterium]|jgi:hypothetical protein|nr:hypothetical protein [Candidatus Acetothermia bacterium]MDH7505164.1 hypothetical protein [Candidatus Acetothermia bacterium]
MSRRRALLKGLAVAFPVIFLLAAAPALFPGARLPQGEIGLQTGTQVSLRFSNDLGIEVCGLQVKFNLPPAEVLGQIKAVTPFKSSIPTIEGNVIYFSGGCVAPGAQVELKLAAPAAITVIDYFWVREGALIPGTSPIEQLVETVTLNKLPLVKTQPKEALVVVRFTLHTPPYGKLLIAQGDTVYENGLIAVKDQPRRDELLAQLASVKKDNLRKQLEAEITALEVRAPVNGLVKEMQVEMGDSTTNVTLKILQATSRS